MRKQRRLAMAMLWMVFLILATPVEASGPTLSATAGCPDCGDWFSAGCDQASYTGCSNDHAMSPYVTALPRSMRSDHRYYAEGVCNSGTCTNVWLIYKLNEPATVSKINFINYQEIYGVKQLRVSTADSLAGPFTVQATFDDLLSRTTGYIGPTTTNHCCTVPDTNLTFDTPPTAQFFKLDVLQNHGNTAVGFYRVQFFDDALYDSSASGAAAAAPTGANCSSYDSCQFCRDGAVAILDPQTATIVDGGGHCILSEGVCVDIYSRSNCSADDSACPTDPSNPEPEPRYLQPAWYQKCSDGGHKIVMGPSGCKGRPKSIGMCSAER